MFVARACCYASGVADTTLTAPFLLKARGLASTEWRIDSAPLASTLSSSGLPVGGFFFEVLLLLFRGYLVTMVGSGCKV